MASHTDGLLNHCLTSGNIKLMGILPVPSYLEQTGAHSKGIQICSVGPPGPTIGRPAPGVAGADNRPSQEHHLFQHMVFATCFSGVDRPSILF